MCPCFKCLFVDSLVMIFGNWNTWVFHRDDLKHLYGLFPLVSHHMILGESFWHFIETFFPLQFYLYFLPWFSFLYLNNFVSTMIQKLKEDTSTSWDDSFSSSTVSTFVRSGGLDGVFLDIGPSLIWSVLILIKTIESIESIMNVSSLITSVSSWSWVFDCPLTIMKK